MLTEKSLAVLRMLIDLTGGTEKSVTYVIGKPLFCLWENRSVTRDFTEYDPEINGIMDALESAGAIKGVGSHVFRLTQIGLHYDELQRLERRERWKERLWGYLGGVLTGVTVTLLVEKALPALFRLLSQP